MSYPLLDGTTLKNVKGFFSPEFRRELAGTARQFGVTEEEVMRERLIARMTGSPVRYSLRQRQDIHLAVDNTQ